MRRTRSTGQTRQVRFLLEEGRLTCLPHSGDDHNGHLFKGLRDQRGQFRTEVERRFVDDLTLYLDYKIREAERIRNERKQLSFW